MDEVVEDLPEHLLPAPAEHPLGGGVGVGDAPLGIHHAERLDGMAGEELDELTLVHPGGIDGVAHRSSRRGAGGGGEQGRDMPR
jgi:hypothetical protein